MRTTASRAPIPPLGLLLLFAGIASFAAWSPVAAQENEECLACHDDPEFTIPGKDGEISFHVDPQDYARSVHGGFDCVDCHMDIAEIPHEDDLEPVDCGICHDDVAELQERSLHGLAANRGDRLAPTCASCHGKHDIKSHTDPTSTTTIMNIPQLCGRCHHEGSPVSLARDIPQDRILENYSLSIHGEGLFRQGLSVTAVCTSCHTAHDILPHGDDRSSIHHDNVAGTCTRCHAQIENVHRKVIDGELWESEPHKIPSCVDCHSPHRVRQAFYPAGTANGDCLRCHGDPELAMERDGRQVPLYVDLPEYEESDHRDTACAQCHVDVTPSRERACETIVSSVDCSICHAEVVDEYEGSTHGTLFADGDPDAPNCQDCHRKHNTLDKDLPQSPTFARNVPQLCGRCHRAGQQAAVRIDSDIPDIVGSYNDSIHGHGLVDSGLLVTATCADCHSAHGELPPEDPGSTVHPDNVADTCGQCHHGIEETFRESVHWPANVETGRELPTCEDCHTSHTIQRVDVPGFRMVMMEQCGHCHENEAETFFDTFHGKVSRLGSEGAAKCYDCHGTHDILRVSDPASHLGRDQVVETCGQCHAGSHRRFAGYLTHATHHDPDRYPFLFWSFWGMTALLVGTLSFAMLHTLAWLIRLLRTKEQWVAHKRTDGGKLIRRFTRKQRAMHMTMILSFFTLALSGMALKFSYMGWAQVLSRLLGGFHTMAVLHRLGAVALTIVFLVHLNDVWRQRREQGISWWKYLTGPDSMLFNKRDLVELWQSVRWFLGRGPRPRYGRFTYWEKFDYFAVFWGVFIIGSTGLLLWFPELFTRVVPGWAVNVATIIHSDEALLAVAFIFTVHFFNTNFRPDKFPIDTVMFTGRVTAEELKYDKPREYEELVADGRINEEVAQLPSPALRGARIFGFTFLSIGVTLIGLIVYSMLFGYR